MAGIIDVIRDHAHRRPDELAVGHIGDDVELVDRLSYRELVDAVAATAASLQATVRRGERALLVFSPGTEFVVALLACLWAGLVAVPVAAPSGRRWAQRLAHIVTDSAPAVVLTDSRQRAEEVADGRPVVVVSSHVTGVARPPVTEPTPGRLAFLQYTSGSTGNPKGVLVGHENLTSNLSAIIEAYEMNSDSVMVSWLPVQHDLGLIGCTLMPLYAGCSTYLMAPSDFSRDPLRWVAAVSRWRATISGGPNSAYEHCARRATEARRPDLDLTSWRIAFSGGEPVRAATIRAFTHAFAGSGFAADAWRPAYGLAEATLMVSTGRLRTARYDDKALAEGHARPATGVDDATELVSCGGWPTGTAVHVRDPATGESLEDGHLGEIVVSGRAVCSGYWAQPDAARPKPLLHTGDIGFIDDGQLFVAGRRDDLVIVEGRNVFPNDVEGVVERAHRALRAGAVAAFGVDVGHTQELVVVAEQWGPPPDGEGPGDAPAVVHAAIREAVVVGLDLFPAQIVLVQRGSLPRTTSGKVRRREARRALLTAQLPVLSQWRRQ